MCNRGPGCSQISCKPAEDLRLVNPQTLQKLPGCLTHRTASHTWNTRRKATGPKRPRVFRKPGNLWDMV
ncbi:hypothetical protein AAFF_G00098110 [Aldrovandia affinis]|uniref:Uncharacterized protein n=1 Tax=Aldrovandia affinis TaxID=143900 RepID=A0AAD7RXP4_9TELE|nr:hypothetical protein AAFF_G00098110 [Aldrovandia affinis]